MRPFLAVLLALFLAACSGAQDDGVVDVAFIGEDGDIEGEGLRLAPVSQHIRAAESQGLVRLDEAGQVVPGIAERWIVTDDGSSYIFRIREFDLPDGSRLTAQAVRDSLRRTVSRLSGTTLGLDLAKIAEIRAMTGRVVEIRLKGHMPGFLQLLAQPELGLMLGESRTGPMALSREDGAAVLDALPPEARGLPIQPDWAEGVRQVRVSVAGALEAAKGFAEGRYDLVLGGTIVDLPVADTGPLARGTIRLDSALGLFGLDVVGRDGFLSQPDNREALAMAIDRDNLLQPFNVGGWVETTRIVPPGLPGGGEESADRWSDLSLEQRRAQAARRVAQWKLASGREIRLRIALPPGPGSDLLFEQLAASFAAIGVDAALTRPGEAADLVLRDRVARYAGSRWYLNQFNCRVSPNVCSEDADYLVQLSLDAASPGEETSYLAEAEATLAATNLYIPLGAPIRWSLARADSEGFIENPWALHALFPLSRAPI